VLTDFGELYGIAESQQLTAYSSQPIPTVVRNVLLLPASRFTLHSSLFSLSGQKVLSLKPGPNDLRRLPAGIYFVCGAQAQAQAVHKVIVTR
jgi:hypothetical protein